MSDYQIQDNKTKTLFYITYRTKKPDGGYKKNYLYNEDGIIVSFTDKTKAEKYRTSLRAKEDAKHDLKKLREKMSKKYGNHYDYIDSYLKQKKKEAPRSWERSEWQLIHYIFNFFLHEKKQGNPSSWPLSFEEFKDWLEKATSIRKNKLSGHSLLAISSMNKIIGDLNGYLAHLFKKNIILIPPAKCEYFSGAEDGYRNGDDIVEEDEYNLVIKKFNALISAKEAEKQKNGIQIKRIKSLTIQIARLQETKLLYIVCRNTGMRISEALGLSFGDFYPKILDDKNLNTLLAKNNLTTTSYIILKSQLGSYNKKDKKWNREPLKTKKKVNDDNSRIIPIFKTQNECDQILKRLHVETQKHFKITDMVEIRANPGQYLFFRNINKNIASSYLKTIYSDLEAKGFKWKSFHCLRHVRATELISQTHDQTLVKLILGHKSRVFERYVHLEASLAKKLTKDQESILLDFEFDEAK